MAYNEPLQSQQVDNLGAINGEILERSAGTWSGQTPVSVIGNIAPPQGRLTLQSGAPVSNTDEAAVSAVYYDSYIGNQVPIYSGTAWAYFAIAADEISMGLDAGVPHVTSGKLYDIFGLNVSSALVIGIGPAWSTSTSRGTGAGTTQLARLNGVWTNAVSLTHCWGGASGVTDYGPVAANTGTYLGTLYATANGQTTMQFNPAAANGGANTFLGLYNAYNREKTTARSNDNSATWTYSTASWRSANNSTSNRVTWIDGLAYSRVESRNQCEVAPSASAGAIGVTFDGTGSPSLSAGGAVGSGMNGTIISFGNLIGLGLHFAQAVEFGVAAGISFGGSFGGLASQEISVALWM